MVFHSFRARRPLGRTGVPVTALGLGDIADRNIPLARLADTLRRGLDAGIHVIDSARLDRIVQEAVPDAFSLAVRVPRAFDWMGSGRGAQEEDRAGVPWPLSFRRTQDNKKPPRMGRLNGVKTRAGRFTFSRQRSGRRLCPN
jgi:hypothetical protein